MKSSKFLLCSLFLAGSLAQSLAQPVVKLSLRSYTDVTNLVTRIGTNVNASLQDMPIQSLKAGMGIDDLSQVDLKKPWEIALWYDISAGMPLLAVKIPAASCDKLKTTLGEGGFLRQEAKQWSQLDNGISLLVFKEADSLTDAEKGWLKDWKAEALQSPARALELNLHLSDAQRAQLTGGLALVKMSAFQAINSQKAPEGAPNPKTVSEMMNIYFEMVETVIAGMQNAKISLELGADSLTVDKVITAKPDSDLARWLKKPAIQLADADLNGLNSAAVASFAGCMGKDAKLQKSMEKLIALSFQMQNAKTDEAAIKETSEILDQLLPMVFTGSFDFKGQLSFSGVYRFPDGKAQDKYSRLVRFMNTSFQSQVGEDKIYSSAKMTEKHHQVNGVQVDRFTLKLNEKSPLLKDARQAEQMKLFWPNFQMQFDYAIKGDQLFVASSEQMQALLEGGAPKSNLAARMKLEDGTCIAGHFNLPALLSQISSMVPEPQKSMFQKLKGKDAAITFQMSLNQQLHSSGTVPMQLLRELGSLGGE